MNLAWFAAVRMQPHVDSVVLSLAFVCASVLLIVWLACRAIDEYFLLRDATLEEMRRFAEAFIREFERPLRQPPFLDAPIRTCIRARPGRGRLKVLLAPHRGRRYPNLSDHRTNVMYDVTRGQPFTCRAISTSGEWVVIAFQHQCQAGRTS